MTRGDSTLSSKLREVVMATALLVLPGLLVVTMTMPWQPYQILKASHWMMQSGSRLACLGEGVSESVFVCSESMCVTLCAIHREIVIELLSQQPEGAFFVRESSTAPGSFALSLMAPEGVVKHFLIEEHDGQYCLCLAVSGRKGLRSNSEHILSSLLPCRTRPSSSHCSPPCQPSSCSTRWTADPSPALSPSPHPTLSSLVTSHSTLLRHLLNHAHLSLSLSLPPPPPPPPPLSLSLSLSPFPPLSLPPSLSLSDWEDSAVTGGGDFLDHHNYHLLD